MQTKKYSYAITNLTIGEMVKVVNCPTKALAVAFDLSEVDGKISHSWDKGMKCWTLTLQLGDQEPQLIACSFFPEPEKALQAPPTTLQSHLIRGLRQLLKDDEHKLKMNMPGAACWLTADGLWLVSKVVADKLRAFLLSQSVDTVPSKNSALFDELQSHRLIEPNTDGNAIWKAKVIDGTWEQEFTFLRVKPSLIYGNEEYPPTFTGTITWDDKLASLPESPVANENAKESAPPPIPMQPAKQQASQMSSKTAVESPTEPAEDDGIDDILSLLGMDTAKDLTTTPDTEKIVNSEQEETEPAAIVQASPKPKQVPAKIPGSQLTPENLGQSFIDWIKAAVGSRSIYINDSRAQIHTVDGKAFLVTPGIFQRFSAQHPELQQLNPDTSVKNWVWVQRSFERLQLHIKREDDLNIWQCTVRGPRVKGNTLNGYLIPTDVIFTFQPQDNPFVTLKADEK